MSETRGPAQKKLAPEHEQTRKATGKAMEEVELKVEELEERIAPIMLQ